MTAVSHRDVLLWMDPWPIRFQTKRQWVIRFATLKQALRYRTFWHDEHGKRVTAATAARRIRKNWLSKDHQIASMAHIGAVLHRPVILVVDGVVVDGNHTLLALERRRFKGRIMVVESRSKGRT